MRIYRQQVDVTIGKSFTLPGFQRALSVAPARDSYAIDLWYLVNDYAEDSHPTEVKVSIAGTGHLLSSVGEDATTFVGTCVMSDGLVWHVFVFANEVTA